MPQDLREASSKVRRGYTNMNILSLRKSAGISRSGLGRQSLVCLLSLALMFATWPLSLSAQDQQDQDAQVPPPQDTQAPPQGGQQAPPYAQQTPEQLQRLACLLYTSRCV